VIVPRVRKVLKSESIIGEPKPSSELRLIKSLRGVPVLKLEDRDSIRLYAFNENGILDVKTVNTPMKELSLGDISIEARNREVVIRSGKGEFRGVGFLKLFGTSAYYLTCRQNNCLAGISDLIDGVVRLYQLRVDGLRPSDMEAVDVSICHGCFSVGGKLFTLYVSAHTAEVLPGLFKLVASCPGGDYLVDKDGFLVRVRKGLLDVLGRFNDVVAATCLSYGLAVADREGLKIVEYGAYTTVFRDSICDLSSHQDVVVATNRSGLVKIMAGENFYALDSPLLNTCEATSEGTVCLAGSYIIFLDPHSPRKVEVVLHEVGSGRKGIFELVATPWYESCHYSISPKIVEVLESTYRDDTLHLTLYPRALGWEGRVKLLVECPTHCSSVEEYVRSGSVTLEEALERQVVVVESGKLVNSEDHNCAGKVSLRITSLYPLPLKLEAKIHGLEHPEITLSQDRILPGHNEISITFSGRYRGREKVAVELFSGLDPAELEQVATVYIEPEHVIEVKPKLNEEMRIMSSEASTTIVLPESYLKLYCSNGTVLEGLGSIHVENCEEPALLQAKKNIDVSGFIFDVNTLKIFRGVTEECVRSPASEKIAKGGFYVNCGKLRALASYLISSKIEYDDSYKLSIYVNSSKILEKKLESWHLIAGLISDVAGTSNVLVSWRNVIEQSIRFASVVGGLLGEVVYGKRNIRT